MSAPYSDDLYSGDVDDEEPVHAAVDASEEDIVSQLSPTDGYFHASPASPSSSSPFHRQSQQFDPPSAHAPRHGVPNVFVEDPTLARGSTAESKAREAREERLGNETLNNSVTDSSAYQPTAPSTAATSYPHQHVASQSTSSIAYTPPATTASPVGSPSLSTSFPERTPLLGVPADAPPAYTPSPTSPTSSRADHPFRAYQTFGNPSVMGNPNESTPFLANEPESMVDHPQRHRGRHPRWINGAQTSTRRRLIIRLLWIGLLASITMAVLTTLSALVSNSGMPDKGKAGDDKPDSVIPVLPDDPTEFPDPGEPWRPARICKAAEYRLPPSTFSVEYAGSRSLSVFQTQYENPTERPNWQIHVFGSIHVAHRNDGAPTGIELEIITNDESIPIIVDWDADEQRLQIETPRAVQWHDSLRPCIQIRLRVWVPAGAELRDVSLQAVHLHEYLAENLDLTVGGKLNLGSVIGQIRSPQAKKTGSGTDEPPAGYKLHARDINVHSVSGDITGWWPLYDSLRAETVSGDITIAVGPQEALKSNPLPATLHVESTSGDVAVSEPIVGSDKDSAPGAALPERDYVFRLKSLSGDIDVAAAFSSSGNIETYSGDVRATLVPLLEASGQAATFESSLKTDSKSGNLAIGVLAPHWTGTASRLANPKPQSGPDTLLPPPPNGAHVTIGDGDPYDILPGSGEEDLGALERALRVIRGTHTSISGNIKLVYPQAFEGEVRASTWSGNIRMAGKDLRIIERSRRTPKRVVGRKGSEVEASLIQASTMSGDVDLVVGDEQ